MTPCRMYRSSRYDGAEISRPVVDAAAAAGPAYDRTRAFPAAQPVEPGPRP